MKEVNLLITGVAAFAFAVILFGGQVFDTTPHSSPTDYREAYPYEDFGGAWQAADNAQGAATFRVPQGGATPTLQVAPQSAPNLQGIKIPHEQDRASFQTTMDALEFGEALGDAKRTFTEADLPYLLASYPVQSGEASQVLNFMNPEDSVRLEENERDVLSLFLVLDDNEPFFQYLLSFSQGLTSMKSCVGSRCELPGIIGTPLMILGRVLQITEAYVQDSTTVLVMSDGENRYEFSSPSSCRGTFEYNHELIEDATVCLHVEDRGSQYLVNAIAYALTLDANIGSRVYVPKGGATKEHVDEPEGFIGPWDVRFEDVPFVQSTQVALDRADNGKRYALTFTNTRGTTYEFTLFSTDGSISLWGDGRDEVVWFTEGYDVLPDDQVIVTSPSQNQAERVTDVLEYAAFDKSDRIVTFENIGTGVVKAVSIDATGRGTLVSSGHSYLVQVQDMDRDDSPIQVDLSGDGEIRPYTKVPLIFTGGGRLPLVGQSGRIQGPDQIAFVTLRQFIEEPSGGDYDVRYNVEVRNGEIYLSYSGSSDPLFDLQSDEANDDYEYGLTRYGALHEFYNPAGSVPPTELRIEYPKSQRFAHVSVVEE